jgi:hypothetical protein
MFTYTQCDRGCFPVSVPSVCGVGLTRNISVTFTLARRIHVNLSATFILSVTRVWQFAIVLRFLLPQRKLITMHLIIWGGIFFVFCWPCILIIFGIKTNLMHCLSIIYFVYQLLHVTGVLLPIIRRYSLYTYVYSEYLPTMGSKNARYMYRLTDEIN